MTRFPPGGTAQALDFLGRQPDGQAALGLQEWREYFAEREQRLYYCNDATGYNSWQPPPCFKFGEWSLDSQVGGACCLHSV